MSLRLALTFALATTLATGCHYQDDCVTLQGDQGAPADPAPGQRNPYTGQCEYYGGGGGGGGTTCGDYGGLEEADRAPLPNWGICDGYCESLTEVDCLEAVDCRASYLDSCVGAGCDEAAEPSFNQCWAVTPGGGFSEDGCNTYDAEECARHNECAPVHGYGISGGAGDFAYCIDESDGSVDPGSCVGEALCEIVPPECPDDTVPGIRDNCYTGYCIPIASCDALPACSEQSEAQCVARTDCEPFYEGIDCTCVGEDCTCAEWIFDTCS